MIRSGGTVDSSFPSIFTCSDERVKREVETHTNTHTYKKKKNICLLETDGAVQRRQSIDTVGAEVDASEAEELLPLEISREGRVVELVLGEIQHL